MRWSWVDTVFSIRRVQHTRSTAFTQDCFFSLHSHDYELTPECSFSFQRVFLHHLPPSASSPWELNVKFTLSHSHSCVLTKWWIESQHPVRRPSTASKYLPIHAWAQPPGACPNSLDHGLQVHLQTRSITTCTCFFRLPWLLPASSYDHHLQVHLQSGSSIACMFAWSLPPSAYLHTRWISPSKFARSWPPQVHISILARSWRPSVSPNSLDYLLEVHHQSLSIIISQCISKFTGLCPPGVAPNTLNPGLQVHLHTRLITASQCISSVTPSSFTGAPRIALKYYL